MNPRQEYAACGAEVNSSDRGEEGMKIVDIRCEKAEVKVERGAEDGGLRTEDGGRRTEE